MNTDMNQYLIFRYASTVLRKMTTYQLCCAGLARSQFVHIEHISSNIYIHLRFPLLASYKCLARQINIWYLRPHFSSTVPGLCNVGGVK